MKKLAILMCSLLASSIILPSFKLSPWVIVDNTTSLDFTCEIEAAIYQDNYEDNNLKLESNNNEYLNVSDVKYYNENNLIIFVIQFNCKSGQVTTLNPVFFADDIMFNPPIRSVKVIHNSLQLTVVCDPEESDQLHFTIEHQLDLGITVKKQTVSTCIKCLNYFKQSVCNAIFAALEAANCLPY